MRGRLTTSSINKSVMACQVIPIIPADKGGFDDTPYDAAFGVDGAQNIDTPRFKKVKIVVDSVNISPYCVTTVTMIPPKRKKK